jgi:alpha-tubulin suppressor-like RCC1 family protein
MTVLRPLCGMHLLVASVIACSSPVEPNEVVVEVRSDRLAVTGAATCLLEHSGSVICWEAGGPRRVTPGDGSLRFASIRGGGSHVCGLTSDSTAYCWGANTYGELGDGTRVSRDTPTRVGGNIKVAAISPSVNTTCALDSSGKAFCWGRREFGSTGDGLAPEGEVELLPKAVQTRVRFKALSGALPNCGITFQGAAYCWGHIPGSFFDPYRAPGDCSSVYYMWYLGRQCLVPTPLSTALEFAALAGDNCGITAAGAAHCWGNGFFGQFGDGRTGVYSVAPVATSGGHQFGHLVSGATHVCGLDATGKALCWGNNFAGQLGIGEPNPQSGVSLRSEPTAVLTQLLFVDIASREARTCALTSGDRVWCWGVSSRIPVEMPLP